MNTALRAQIIALAQNARDAHEARHPLDAISDDTFTAKITRVLDNPDTLYSVVTGPDTTRPIAFVAGTLVNAPPVYNPGGPVCFVEFSASRPDINLAVMLRKLGKRAKERGAVLLVVHCSEGDTNKQTRLENAGYTVASAWYRHTLPLTEPAADMTTTERLRSASAADVPAMLAIGERKREEYEVYQPVFWKKADTPREEFAPFVTGKVENENVVALVSENETGDINGYLLAERDGYIDDYAVATPALWPTAGRALLLEAARRAGEKGTAGFLVVCGNRDVPKRTLLQHLNFDLCLNWYTLPLS